MNKTRTYRTDDKTEEVLEWIKNKLKISKSDATRMAIRHFKSYVERVSN